MTNSPRSCCSASQCGPPGDAVGECEHLSGHRLRISMSLSHEKIGVVTYETSAPLDHPLRIVAMLGCTLLHGMTLEEARHLTARFLKSAGGIHPRYRHAVWMFIECMQKALGPQSTSPAPDSQKGRFHAHGL